VDWIVIGGESGQGARAMDPLWAWSLVEQARVGGTVPFVKQLGSVWARGAGADSKGGDWRYWPMGLRVRDYPGGPS
jgi:protein gp37